MRRQVGPAVVSATVVLVLLAAPAESSSRSSSHDWAYALAIQNDGNIVAAGLGKGGFALARYTTTGHVDPTFGSGGTVVAAGIASASAVAVGADRKIVAGGGRFSRGCGKCALVRYTVRGRPDRTFGSGGKAATGVGVNGIAIQKDGRIVAVGAELARYTKRGGRDSSFGRAGKVQPAFGGKIALQVDGKIVVAGESFVHGSFGFGLARYDRDGTIDASFGNGGKVVIGFGAHSGPILRAMAIQPDGKIVAAGEAHFSDFALARFTSDGRLDPTFGEGGKVLTDFTSASTCEGCSNSDDSAHALAIQADGKIVAVGESDARGDVDERDHSLFDFALARYNDDGSLDTSFGSGGKVLTSFAGRPSHKATSSIAEAVEIQRDGKLVIAGLGTGYDFALARYTMSGRLDGRFGRGGKVMTDFGSG